MPFVKPLYAKWVKKTAITDEFERSKVRLILSFSLIGILVSLLYFGVHPVIPFNVPRPVFVLLPALLCVGCFFMLSRIHHHPVAHFVIFSFWICFVIGSYYSGGIKSIVLPWLALMPVMASLLTNYRGAVSWFLVSFFTTLLFIVYADAVPAIQSDNLYRYSFSIVGLCLTLFLFTSLFDKTRYKILQLLKARNAELANKQIQIQNKNELIVAQNEEIKAANEQLRQKNETLEKHWNTLIEVSKNKHLSFGTLEESLNYVAHTTAHSLQVSRVSVWLYQEENLHEKIECISAYSLDKDEYYKHENLMRDDNASYFEAIKREKIIAANDALQHPDTADFSEKYLKPLGIFSMMDAPFFLDGRLAGVLCCEHQKEQKNWTAEDIIFATSMADIVSLAFRAAARRAYEKELRQLSREVRQQNELLKQKSEEVEKINQSLETRVAHRTRELLDKNRQLAEYAFINSHLLRGPLCRILGLINLFDYSEIRLRENELIERLKISSKELDEVVSKINETIDHDSEFDTSDFPTNNL